MALLRSLGSRHMQSVPSGLWGYDRGETHLVNWVTGAIMALSTMLWRVCSICFWYSMGTFHGYARQGWQKGWSWWYRSLTCCLWCWKSQGRLAPRQWCPGPLLLRGVAVTSTDLDLRPGLGLVEGGWGTWALRTGRGRCGDDDRHLCYVPLMADFTGSLKLTDLAVFLKLLWGKVWHGWSRSRRGHGRWCIWQSCSCHQG